MESEKLAKQIRLWQEKERDPLSIKKKIPYKSNNVPPQSYRYYLMREEKEIYLTLREMELVRYLLTPLTYRLIGEKMNLSPRTIECHVRRMRLRLGCKNRVDLLEHLALISKESKWNQVLACLLLCNS